MAASRLTPPAALTTPATDICCVETGVGSGTVYSEKNLFPSEQEALVAAQACADHSNATSEWISKLYNKSLKVSDYELESAALHAAKVARSNADAMLWNLGDLFNKIEEAADKDEILEAVEDYKRLDWERDKAKTEKVSEEHGC